MIRALRFLGLLIAHTVVAIIGPAIVEHAIWTLVPAHSVVGLLWKEIILGALSAACIGFGIWRAWRSSVAKWTWVLAVPWFVFGFLMVHGNVFGNLLPPPSGSVLAGPDASGFLAFSVPLIRTIFYSLGAHISSLLMRGGVTRTQVG